MQVFLPYPDYEQSIFCLDKKRCFKQLVEAKQLIDSLTGRGSLRWAAHPASRKFKFNINSLIKYHNICYSRNKDFWQIRMVKSRPIQYIDEHHEDPIWLGDKQYHSVMRAKLLGKNPNWYGQFGWTESPLFKDDEYFWPIDKQFKYVRNFSL